MRRAVNFEFILVVGEAQDHMRKRLIAELRGCFGAEHPRTVATYPRKLVVFKPETFKQMADYVHPHILSEGMDALFVTGKLAVLDSKDTGVLAGQVKHKPTPGTCP